MIPKTGSRTIVVDHQKYHWRVRKKPTYSQGAFATELTFSVQHTNGGAVLRVKTHGPRPDNWLQKVGVVVTPVIVEAAIRQAYEQGWCADKAGPVFELTLSSEPATLCPA